MLLYHGSNKEVVEPNLYMSRKYLDFGIGFYLTSNKEQAIVFSQKVVLREKRNKRPSGVATINVYSFELEQGKHEPNILNFSNPCDEWLDYVIKNSVEPDEADKSDIVIGPVANDDVYAVIDFYEKGALSRKEAIDALKVRKLFNQYTFKTENALKYLRFISSQCIEEE